MLRPRASVAAVVAVLAVVGCGSTVQQTARAGSANQLGLPASGSPANGQATSQPGGNGGVTGAGGSAPGAVGNGGPTAGVTGGNGAGTTASSSAGSNTGPLQLGVLDASSPTAAAAATGASNPAGVDPVALTHAFINYYNAHGGMAGRKVQVVEATINPTSSSYESDLSAACAKFTQDNHVKLVVTQTGNIFSSNYESCLAKKGVTNLEVGNGAPDAQDVRSFPQLFTTASPTVDRRVTAALRGLTQTRLLTRRDKLGVVVEDCPENIRAYTRALEPAAKSLGIALMRSDVDCVAGFSDAGKFFAQVGQAVLPFHSNGVTWVTFMTSFEVAALQAFENQAQSQAWKPKYALSSLAATAANANQYTADSQSRMFGVGWLPVVDASGVPPASSAAKQCAAVARSAGITVSSQADYAFLYQICDLFAVLNASLVAANGHDDPATFAAGVAAAMPSFQSAYVLGGRLRLDRSIHDAPISFSVFGYQQSCTCFRYRTNPTQWA